MIVNYIRYLPILIFVWFITTFIITYSMAVWNDHIYPFFSYISDTGTNPPESCVFGQMLNVGAIFMGLLVYIRHRQIKEVCEMNGLPESILKQNKISTGFGLSAAFGVSMVGNFQVTNLLVTHMIGAFTAFGLGTTWGCLQTWLSFKIYPTMGRRSIIYVRLILTVICCTSFLLSFTFGILAFVNFKGTNITKWGKDDGGYEYHVISVISEWIVVILTMCYISTYATDFRHVSFDHPVIRLS